MNYSVPKLIAQYSMAGVLIGLGMFMTIKHHPMAGGWITTIGLLGYCFASGRTGRGAR